MLRESLSLSKITPLHFILCPSLGGVLGVLVGGLQQGRRLARLQQQRERNSKLLSLLVLSRKHRSCLPNVSVETQITMKELPSWKPAGAAQAHHRGLLSSKRFLPLQTRGQGRIRKPKLNCIQNHPLPAVGHLEVQWEQVGTVSLRRTSESEVGVSNLEAAMGEQLLHSLRMHHTVFE